MTKLNTISILVHKENYMELSEFISLAKANIESEYFSGECSIREHYAENYATVTKERDWQKRKTQIKVIANSMESDDFIWVQFETGGTSGGSCWDDSDPQDYHCDGEDSLKNVAHHTTLSGQIRIILVGLIAQRAFATFQA